MWGSRRDYGDMNGKVQCMVGTMTLWSAERIRDCESATWVQGAKCWAWLKLVHIWHSYSLEAFKCPRFYHHSLGVPWTRWLWRSFFPKSLELWLAGSPLFHDTLGYPSFLLSSGPKGCTWAQNVQVHPSHLLGPLSEKTPLFLSSCSIILALATCPNEKLLRFSS